MHCQGYQVTMAIEQSSYAFSGETCKCAMSGVLRRHSTITLRAHECLHLHQHTTGATINLVDLNCKRKYCCDKKPYIPLLSCSTHNLRGTVFSNCEDVRHHWAWVWNIHVQVHVQSWRCQYTCVYTMSWFISLESVYSYTIKDSRLLHWHMKSEITKERIDYSMLV